MFFQDDDGTARWPCGWPRDLGHELRGPEADTLRDGIHELRARLGHVNYRILYFIPHERVVAVLLHALMKEDPGGHTFRGPMP